jgi:hypothetical protein
MANKHLQNKPHHVKQNGKKRDDVWWYEEKGGIDVVTSYKLDGYGYIRTIQFRIPWNSIRAALARKDKSDAPT